MRQNPRPNKARPLIRSLERIRSQVVGLERSLDLSPFRGRRSSARNLLHYLALRRVDLRGIQDELSRLGLSSLGRAESHVLSNLDAVLRNLYRLGELSPPPGTTRARVDSDDGSRFLARNATRLLGPSRPERKTRIIVTMPSEAASDHSLVRDLLEAGMDCMRINCAHDSPREWTRMISSLDRAKKSVGRSCRVEMDLGGPKLRTGPVEAGAPVLKVRPRRDEFGRVVGRATVWLTSAEAPVAPTDPADGVLPVSPDWLSVRQPGERIRFRDARGARRTLRVVSRDGDSLRAESSKTIYFTNGLTLSASGRGRPSRTELQKIPGREQVLLLHRGDTLLLTARPDPGRPAQRSRDGRATAPATISCRLPEAFPFVRRNDRIFLDDGKIGGTVVGTEPGVLRILITQAATGGSRLGGDKGINLPDSDLKLPALTEKDREDLEFISRHADMVGYSFVHDAGDVEMLRAELASHRRSGLGIILKIETRQAFDELPAILLAALKAPRAGVMIARGDLAVEVGYERLSEVQEEILWLCEAAHLPAIWATQVLEALTKEGVPSRAEVTDAAMGERAEGVLLNKGPHVVEAVRALDNILRRMEAHQAKKSSRLRHLNVAGEFFRRSAPRRRAELGSRPPRRPSPPAPSPSADPSGPGGPGQFGSRRFKGEALIDETR